jgi:hypothetical protein
VVGAGAHDANVDSIALVPAGKTIDNVDTFSGIEVINSALSVDAPDLMQILNGSPFLAFGKGIGKSGGHMKNVIAYLWTHSFIDRSPPDILLRTPFPHDTFI